MPSTGRSLALFALLAAVVVGVAMCAMRPSAERAPAPIADDGATTARPPGDARGASGAASTSDPNARARDTAMQDAVALVHRYLGLVGGRDFDAADALWSGGRLPATPQEADLRTLEPLHALRIRNGTPQALDAGPVPAALEVPVDLRAGVGAGAQRRYSGWYRVRKQVAGDGWEITSARVERVPGPQAARPQ